MARVQFFQPFDYSPKINVILAYGVGIYDDVKRACADQAIAEGKAVELKPLTRDEAAARPARRRKAAG